MYAVDRYTKAVLTVIAASLVWIAMRDLFAVPRAYAQARGQIGAVTDVRIVGYTAAVPLPVDVQFVANQLAVGAAMYAPVSSSNPLPVAARGLP
jgi:hypothetical protein